MFLRFDVGHPKQARQAATIIRSLGLERTDFVVSARGALNASEVAEALGLEPLVIGGYSGDLYRKLVDDLLRAKRLADIAQAFPKDTVLISFGMPSGIRVAFGLKIPIIHMNDTPHNEPVRRLTAPLSDYIITPMPEVKNRLDTPPKRAIIGFYGVPEMSYVEIAEELMPGRPLEEAKKLIKEISPFIVFRYAERKSSYAKGSLAEFRETFETVYSFARENGLNVLLYSRYPEEIVNKDGVYTLDRLVNMPYLIRHARFVVSAGGTLAKEASLQGVPAIVTHYRLDSTKRLVKEGFPIIDGRRNLIEALEKALEKSESSEKPSLQKYDKLPDVVEKCLSLL